MRLFLEAARISGAGRMPEIEIVARGKPPKIIKEDWVDPFIRSLVGYRADPEARLLVHILDSGKREVPISRLTSSEIELLPKLEKLKRVTISRDLKIRLTKLGAILARGAKKLYPEFWS